MSDRTTSFCADLHCHSTVSDGLLAPDVVARRAKEEEAHGSSSEQRDREGNIKSESGDWENPWKLNELAQLR